MNSANPPYQDLHSACRSGNLSLIKQAYTSDPSKLNDKDTSLGWCPLYRSVICNHYEAAYFLLAQGADPNTANNLGETSLHQTADNSQYSLAELLLKYKANPNFQQKDGDTPLHHAAFRGDTHMVELLLSSGANPNIVNFMVTYIKFGRTPLHYASDCGRSECVRILINNKGDLQIKDRQGKNAVELAGNPETIRVINEFLTSEAHNNSVSPIGEVTTYIVSEAGDERNLNQFDTFGVESQCQVFKQSIVSPVPEISSNSYSLYPIYPWLEKCRLESCYESLVEAGYYSVDIMARQMNSSMPITERNLKEIGVHKPGHRRLLLIKLEVEAGMTKSFSVSYLNGKSQCFRCCSQELVNINRIPSLFEWLEMLNLDHIHYKFLEAGYESYEGLLEIQSSQHPLNIRLLEQEVGITNLEERLLIIKRLQMDLKDYDPSAFDAKPPIGCEFCVIS